MTVAWLHSCGYGPSEPKEASSQGTPHQGCRAALRLSGHNKSRWTADTWIPTLDRSVTHLRTLKPTRLPPATLTAALQLPSHRINCEQQPQRDPGGHRRGYLSHLLPGSQAFAGGASAFVGNATIRRRVRRQLYCRNTKTARKTVFLPVKSSETGNGPLSNHSNRFSIQTPR